MDCGNNHCHGEANITSRSECQTWCRNSVQCWAYLFNNSTCYSAGFRCSQGPDVACDNATVVVKHHCPLGQLCVQLQMEENSLSGQYTAPELQPVMFE